jgi:hypothetical protein
MLFAIDERVRRRAKTPHEISMFNLMFFHLLLGAGTLVLVMTGAEFLQRLGHWGVVAPLLASLSVIAYIHIRALRAPGHEEEWFVAAHWGLARQRTLILLGGYAITGLILALAFLASSGSSKGEIMFVAFTRVSVVPTLLAVMVCFVLESGSIYQAGRGEVPNGLARRFPPPEGLEPVEEAPAAAPGRGA